MVTDSFGNQWPDSFELCPTCKQPDNCGDCDHTPLPASEVSELGGIPCTRFII